MRVKVNGGVVEAPAGESLGGLLTRLGVSLAGAAIERNGKVVRKRDLEATALAEGDSIEVVRPVGGG